MLILASVLKGTKGVWKHNPTTPSMPLIGEISNVGDKMGCIQGRATVIKAKQLNWQSHCGANGLPTDTCRLNWVLKRSEL